MTPRSTRRFFLGATATAASLSARAHAAGRGGPNDTVRLALVGCGGRGRYLMQRFRELPDASFVAVCDVHAGRAAQARKESANPDADATGDFRRILDRKDVDAVIVATTGHWHVLPTVEACKAGKDVYVEKPLGTSVAEGRAAVEAARKFNRIVQIGTQQRSWDHYHKAVELIQAGRLGEISEVKVWDYENDYPGFGSSPDAPAPAELDWNFFVGPAPERPFNPNRFDHHYWYYDYGGGWPLDWAVHHYDIVHWAMGVDAPVSAVASGGKLGLPDDDRDWPDTFGGILEYGPGPVAKRGFLLNYAFRAACAGQPNTHAKAFYGSEASMLLDRSGAYITGESRKGKKLSSDETIPGGGEDHFVTVHAGNFLQCLRSRKTPFASVEVGHHSSNPGHLLNIALRTGRKITWDAEAERIPDDPEACALLSRSYRAPWKLED